MSTGGLPVAQTTFMVTNPLPPADPENGAGRSGAFRVRKPEDSVGGLHEGTASGAPWVMPDGEEPGTG